MRRNWSQPVSTSATSAVAMVSSPTQPQQLPGNGISSPDVGACASSSGFVFGTLLESAAEGKSCDTRETQLVPQPQEEHADVISLSSCQADTSSSLDMVILDSNGEEKADGPVPEMGKADQSINIHIKLHICNNNIYCFVLLVKYMYTLSLPSLSDMVILMEQVKILFM